jgi:hypothetical protein
MEVKGSPQIGECPSCRAAIFADYVEPWCPVCGKDLPGDMTGQLPFLKEYPKRFTAAGSERPALVGVLQFLAFVAVGGGLLAGGVELTAKDASPVVVWIGISVGANGIVGGLLLYAIGEILEHVAAIRKRG